jgi:redox-sensitive bicupin YhaK (pirin superfamily)
VLPYREVPLGGPRAMPVRRSLPQRDRTLIGAWCFVDHYGPDDVSLSGGMEVPGHPHTGLQTVSWLFSGEVEHRDTTGAHAFVRPGRLGIMTAGSGIAHSEYSTPGTTVLHGAQLWVALPEAARDTEPGFEEFEPEVVDVDGAQLMVFIGSLLGQTSPVPMHSPLVGAEVTVPPGASLRLPLNGDFEHGFLCDTGVLAVASAGGAGPSEAKPGEIAFVPAGATEVTLTSGSADATRLLVLGGAPFGEQIVMWWNFVGRSHDEVVGFRDDWQRERASAPGQPSQPSQPEAPGEPSGIQRRFGLFPAEWERTLPAPELPNLRLRARN